MRVDLHLHSAVSDGTQTPTELLHEAHAAGLDVVALTDHDTTAGWAEAGAAAERLGVTLVPGVEISCRWYPPGDPVGIGVHLLSYLHDDTDDALTAELHRTRSDRVGRARRMVERIAVDHPLEWEEVLEQLSDGATVGRPHIADAMVARGHVTSRDEAFERVLHARSPYYVAHHAPDPVDAVRLVVGAGGVAVMAHPRAARRGRVVPDQVIADLAAAGLSGLEVNHRDNDPRARAELRALAADLHLFTTGSSDYHGAGKVNLLGENLTAPTVLEQILDGARRPT